MENLNHKNKALVNSRNQINSQFILDSSDAWEIDKEKRFNLDKLNARFRESIPVLDFLDWRIENIKRGYAETVLPLNVASSNQYISHQAALMLLSADYTGGIALATLFHLAPIVGFFEVFDEYAIYMWGAKSTIRWIRPSTSDLICRSTIPEESREVLVNRMNASKKVLFTGKVEMFNGTKLVADCDFTYWAEDIHGLRKKAMDTDKIEVLYEHKLKTTAKLISGFRALEQEEGESRLDDPFASVIAGKHGITLAQRFKKHSPQLQDMVVARAKHLDNAVLEFVKDKDSYNIVNIGSGYDNRFIRLDLSKGNIFDLDLPTMLKDRDKIFNISSRENVKLVPIDLITQDIEEVLLNPANGFNKDLPTFFIWEGGSMYFGQNEINKIFKAFSKLLNKNNRLWFDYVLSDIILDKTNIKEIEDFMKSMRIMGEAFINGFKDIYLFVKKYNLEVLNNEKSSKILNIEQPHFEYYNFCIVSKK